jgi:hypothetical protein
MAMTMARSRTRVPLAAGAAMIAAALAAPRAAHACGGFFCNPPNQPGGDPPIAQAAENVLFALGRDPITGRGRVEAHVQIVYTGAADQFSWVVPVPSVPEVDVGSDLAFAIIEPRTRPSFQVQQVVEGTCKGQGRSQGFGCAGGSYSATGSAPGPGADAGTGTPTVEVAFRGNVGPYESAVIRSEDPAALEAWLVEHAYFVSPEASQIIRGYVDAGNYFVALRLQAGRDVNEIEPVVLRMGAEEGCVPLKLTAIAATPNLRVNVWVLGAGRAVPINYTEVDVNWLRLDWFNRGLNYDTLVAEAVNDAGGNAFLTEYAQPAVSAVSWFPASSSVYERLATARTALDLWLGVQGSGLPLSGSLLRILQKYIPIPATVPAAITPAQFYGSFPRQPASVTGAGVDGAAAAVEIRDRVLVPLDKVRTLVAGHATLTRLATFISPEEMTKDPLFVTNSTLPLLSNQHTAVARMRCGDEDYDTCSAPVTLELESGEKLSFRGAGGQSCNFGVPPTYDRGQLDAMPAALRGWRRDPVGAGDLVLDNTSAIAAAAGMHNAASSDGGGCALVAETARRPARTLALLLGVLLLVSLRRRRRSPPSPGGSDG